MSLGKPFTALESLALGKICNVLRGCCEALPTASFWARELGMVDMERELVEIQDALVANREAMVAALKLCPALPGKSLLPGSVKLDAA